MGRGGGHVVSVLASTPTIQVRILCLYSLSVSFVLEKNKIYQKRPGFSLFKTTKEQNRFFQNILLVKKSNYAMLK